MKKLILLAGVLLSVHSVQAQTTNTYYGPLTITSKEKFTCPPGTKVHWIDGNAIYHPTSMVLSNTYYWPDAGVSNLTLTATNPLMVVQYTSGFGDNACGTNHIAWVDQWGGNVGYRFSQYWPTNLVLPATNSLIPILATGFHTNTP